MHNPQELHILWNAPQKQNCGDILSVNIFFVKIAFRDIVWYPKTNTYISTGIAPGSQHEINTWSWP